MQIRWRKFQMVSRSGRRVAYCESFVPVSLAAFEALMDGGRDGRSPISYDQANARFSRAYFDLCDQRDSTREQCDRFRNDFIGWLNRNELFLELDDDDYCLAESPAQ